MSESVMKIRHPSNAPVWTLVTITALLVFIMSAMKIQGTVITALVIVFILVTAFTALCVTFQWKKTDFAPLFCLPFLISAFQNIYLGIAADVLNSQQLQILLSVGYVTVVLSTLVLFLSSDRKQVPKDISIPLLVLVIYCFVLLPFNSTSLASFISCLRNITTVGLYTIFGYLLGRHMRLNTGCSLVAGIGLATCIVGYYEVMIDPQFWLKFNIDELWNLKGIGVGSTGLPSNFYSSEIVFGHQLRRMSSTFADPVNLGTFLFVALISSWYLHLTLPFVIILGGCILTVSKGALLGILVFFVVWVSVFHRHSLRRYLVFGGVMVAATGFLYYSLTKTTGSVAAHINGFINSFSVLLDNPLGYGCGRVGVLASLNASTETNIIESGFGVIAGQLGVLGLILFAIIFWSLIEKGNKISTSRERVLVLTIVLALLINILFNEVALSPNSSGSGFALVGLALSQRSFPNRQMKFYR